MITPSALSLLALASLVSGSPTPNSKKHAKRHFECWRTNVQGCEYPITGSNGAVVSEVGTCSEIGIDILKQGGNAADAIIATGLCVGTINAFHSGIGGGGFMLVRFNNPNGTHGYETIDFRETMPAAGNETLYSAYGVNQTKSTIGGLAVGVPGELRGWEQLHSRHGSLPWKDLFQPAINLARNGFPVNVDLASYIASNAAWIENSTIWSETYAPNGSVVGYKDIIYRQRYANTLQTIADQGVDVFYQNSTIASNIIKSIRETGGIMTLDDLAGYNAIIRRAGMIEYSSGSVVLSALNIFSGYDGSAEDSDPQINLTTHRLVEATKFAYGQRANFGDPAFTANVTSLEESYLTDAVSAEARARIVDNTTFGTAYYDPSLYVPSAESGTSHMAAADKNGMAVSLTTTVNLIFGSHVMTSDGIILNDEMDDFSSPGQINSFGFAASPINYIAPGKRPQSSIASSIVEDAATGEFMMATGSAGGSQIITATIQQLYHYIDQKDNATQSTDHPRWHDQLSGTTIFELPNPNLGLTGYDNGTVAYFKSLGYNVTYAASGSTSHAIGRLPDGQLLAASDPRKAAGYGAAY